MLSKHPRTGKELCTSLEFQSTTLLKSLNMTIKICNKGSNRMVDVALKILLDKQDGIYY